MYNLRLAWALKVFVVWFVVVCVGLWCFVVWFVVVYGVLWCLVPPSERALYSGGKWSITEKTTVISFCKTGGVGVYFTVEQGIFQDLTENKSLS